MLKTGLLSAKTSVHLWRQRTKLWATRQRQHCSILICLHNSASLTNQLVSASARQRPSLPGLPWQSGHTSWATAGSQCCPCARGRSRGDTREASAAWPAGWWDSSRHPAGAPSGGAPCSPWWGPPVESREHLQFSEIYTFWIFADPYACKAVITWAERWHHLLF